MRDDDLRSPNYFDVAKFPTLTFTSKRVQAAGTGKLKVTGDLTIHALFSDRAEIKRGDVIGLRPKPGRSHLFGAESQLRIG